MHKLLKQIAIVCILIIAISVIVIAIVGGGFGSKDKISFNDGEPLVFAHRGYCQFNAENSREAFDESIKIGFDAIETDVEITKDNRLVLFHDKSCKRLLGIDTNINQLNLAEIQNKVLTYKGKPTNSSPVSLDCFLKNYKNLNAIYLDIKSPSILVADSLIDIIQQNNMEGNTIIADENFWFIFYIKYRNPKIMTCLEGFNSGKEWLYGIMPLKFKPDFYSSFINKVDSKHVEFLKKEDLLSNKIVYSVCDDNIEYVYELGLCNIIFDIDTTKSSVYRIKKSLSRE